MTKPKAPKKKRAKAGTSKEAALEKKRLFAEAMLSNNGNKRQAALAAGFSPTTADKAGQRLAKDGQVMSMLDIRRTETLSGMQITTERVLEETARLAFSDVSKIIGPTGKVLLPNELDPATRAAVSSFEIDEYGRIKYKFWDKNNASERLFKYLDLYKDDNKGKAPLLQVAIVQLVPLQPAVKKGVTLDADG